MTGNLLKRLCTIGWVLTSLIALALFADSPELIADPDKTWGVASRELLGPGLTGLMLACLLAALMSSVDAYMLVSSALVVRNLYVAFLRPKATEKECLFVARITGMFVVAGAVIISLTWMDVFQQLQLTWVFPILFAAVFWTGLYWRRATTSAAWITIAFVAITFFVLPAVLPNVTNWRDDPAFLVRNQVVETTIKRTAAPSDVARRIAEIQSWNESEMTSPEPRPLQVGETLTETTKSGGKSVFWSKGVVPVDENGADTSVAMMPVGDPIVVDENTTRQILEYPEGTTLQGRGNVRVDFLLYKPFLDLTKYSNAILDTLELPLKIVLPFAVMIVCSLLTPRNNRASLDRHYAKMKTAVEPDQELDRQNLEVAYADYAPFEKRKVFPNSDFELERPDRMDVVGGVLTVAACFGVVLLAIWIAGLGA